MITRIELENFKGIRERVSLDLKPVTLLFGANSSGKSTVIHALHYAFEVLHHHNLDADHTTLGGEAVDLGGFRNMVHGHDLERRIGMFFEFEVDGSLADYTEGISDVTPVYSGPPGPNLEGSDMADRLFTAWVRMEIGWSRPTGMPQVFAYEVGANGNYEESVIRIEAGAGKGQTPTLVVRTRNAVFGVPIEPDEPSALEDLLSGADIVFREGSASLPVYGQVSALPEWGRPLRLWVADDMTPIPEPLKELRRLLSRFVVGVGELLGTKLQRLLYVGPLRTVPSRNYRPPLTESLARWADGLGAWDALHRQGGALVSRASTWMNRLEIGYRLELRRLAELDADAAGRLRTLVDDLLYTAGAADAPPGSKARDGKRAQAGASSGDDGVAEARAALWSEGLDALQSASVREELVLVDQRNGVTVRPSDVGVGISQVLPVVVAALYRGERGAGAFVVVEQPELHIHPKLQVALADLFIEQSSAGSVSDHWFLLETHSEHILLRLLRRIRETYGALSKRDASEGADGNQSREDGGAGVPKEGITPAHVSIIYVQRADDGSTTFAPLRVDERGEFLDVWPEGFFEERDPELFG